MSPASRRAARWVAIALASSAGALLVACSAVLGLEDVSLNTSPGGAAGGTGSGGCTSMSECDDKNPCTFDACVSASCVNFPAAGLPCADGDKCNGDEVCDPAGKCQPGTPLAGLDDGSACTDDKCNPVTSGITHVQKELDDADACTADSCDAATGKVKHTALAVDDGNPCTLDICDPNGGGVSHTPVVLADGDPCTTDACDRTNGVTHTPIAGCTGCTDVSQCVDGNPCTTKACTPGQGINGCVYSAGTPGTACADTNKCNGDETCDDKGKCQPGTPLRVDDGNPCTKDSCSAMGGVAHARVDAEDGDKCTVDQCDPKTGVTHTPVDPSDDNQCTQDACDPKTGTISHAPVQVDDHLACTQDGCDPTAGVTHAPVPTDDGDPCTTDGCAEPGGVYHKPIPGCTGCKGADNCNDNNPCTLDACKDGQCVRSAADTGTSCADTNQCNGDETCDGAGKCQPGTPINLDDGRACTTDSCDASTGGVVHTDNCMAPDTCGGGGDPNACGCSAVPPGKLCASMSFACGVVINNCGQQVTCGACGTYQTCVDGLCGCGNCPGGYACDKAGGACVTTCEDGQTTCSAPAVCICGGGVVEHSTSPSGPPGFMPPVDDCYCSSDIGGVQ